jgi:metal-sulfur cluster biosynthetic enzyme
MDSPDREPIDSIGIYEQIRSILHPERPLTLEQLQIVSPQDITVDDSEGSVDAIFTPTVPNCTLPAVLGLCIREKRLQFLPLRFHSKICVVCAPGKDIQEDSINRMD